MKNKAQESAIFELLVAVVIMGFVIVIGLNAMDTITKEQCKTKTEASLDALKTKIEAVVNSRSPQSFTFRTSGCVSSKNEVIKLIDMDNPELCASYCETNKPVCSLLVYTDQSPKQRIPTIIKCVNINPATNFVSATGGRCPEKEGYVLINFNQKIEQGYYVLENMTKIEETFPTICAYLKKRKVE